MITAPLGNTTPPGSTVNWHPGKSTVPPPGNVKLPSGLIVEFPLGVTIPSSVVSNFTSAPGIVIVPLAFGNTGLPPGGVAWPFCPIFESLGNVISLLLSGLLGNVIVPPTGIVRLPAEFTVIGPLPSGLTTGLSCGLLVILSSFPGNSTPPSGWGRTSLPFGVITVPSGLIVLPPGILVTSSLFPLGNVIVPFPSFGIVTVPSRLIVNGPLPPFLTSGLSCGLLVILPSIPDNSTPPNGWGRTSLPFGVIIVPSGVGVMLAGSNKVKIPSSASPLALMSTIDWFALLTSSAIILDIGRTEVAINNKPTAWNNFFIFLLL